MNNCGCKLDFFVVEGIENWPGTSLTVYDRWGTQVCHSDNYQNEWGGLVRDSDREVASGTYYYVMIRPFDSEPIFGFISVIREK